MSRADAGLTGADLWDWLRTESLTAYEETGGWPTSDSQEAMDRHITEFCELVLEPGARIQNRGDITTLHGTIRPRFSMVPRH